jgi:DNA-binding NarL/FixJ family response regulator
MSGPIRLLIADDHPVVRDGLIGLFSRDDDFEVLGEAADGAEAVRLAERLAPDVILMDLRMPQVDGVTAIAELARRGVTARVLVLTTFDTDSDVLPATEAGATGYLLKDAPPEELAAAVRTAAAGRTTLAPAVADRLMNRLRVPGTTLTKRETEVLTLVADGLSNQAIGRRLYLTEGTIKSHLVRIYTKLGVDSRTAAIASATRLGLIRR